MLPDSKDTRRAGWLARAGRLRRRILLAWWLDAAELPGLALGVVAAASIVTMRRGATELGVVALLLLVAALGVAAHALHRVWSRCPDLEASLARLDVGEDLEGALVAAAHLGAWPPLPTGGEGVRWRPLRATLPIATAAVLVLSALLVPVAPTLRAAQATDAFAPPAWAAAEQELLRLREGGDVDSMELAPLEDGLARLRARPRRAWYDHATLEASDSLAEKVRAAREASADRTRARLRSAAKGPMATRPDDEAASPSLGSEGQAAPGSSSSTWQQGPGEVAPERRSEAERQLGEARRRRERERAGQRGQSGPTCDGEGAAEGEGGGSCDRPGDGARGGQDGGEDSGGAPEGRGGPGGGGGASGAVSGNEPHRRIRGDARAERLASEVRTAPLTGAVVRLRPTAPRIDPDAPASEVAAGGGPASHGGVAWIDDFRPAERRFLERYFR